MRAALPAPWVVPTAIAASLFVLAWTFYPVVAMQYRENRQRAQLSAELESLRARNDRLRKEVDKLKTPAGVEDYARSQLGFVKKGENVVVVVDEESTATVSQRTPDAVGSDETTVAPAGPWTAFLDLVFGVQ